MLNNTEHSRTIL